MDKNIFSISAAHKTDFELAFSDLKNLVSSRVHGAKRTYEVLKKLNQETSKHTTDELITELKKIRYASNTNSVFYFYLPIVSHILFYKPEYEKEILGMVIGPNFANGESDAEGMITVIQGAMEFKLKESPKYLTQEGQFWINNVLPKMRTAVKREIEICREELNE